MNQTKKLHPALAALIVIVLVGIVASAVIVINNNQGNKTATTKSDTTHDHEHSGTTDSVKAPESTDTSAYKDGTYSATGSYISPAGSESIKLTVTIKDGVITETSTENLATDAEAKQHQELFSDHYKTLIVGKKINEVGSLSRVAGSSLTSNGFNDALHHIKHDAEV